MREEYRVGLDYLGAATALLRRARSAHPTAGLLEAADLQWWWRASRPTDVFPQLFWFDDRGQPEAALIATDWGDGVALDPIVLPDAKPDWITHVIERGLAYAGESGFKTIEIAVDRTDDLLCTLLTRHGFAMTPGASLEVVCAWRAAHLGPRVRPLQDGYRLCSRLETEPFPHHMAGRSGQEVGERLRQTSLYRPDLDLLILDQHDQVAAYGLFWFDPLTATGLVEPMRTERAHQRRGLAHHLLAAGMSRLAQAGAQRIKLCYSPGNQAARDLYLSHGFEPHQQTAVFSQRDLASGS